MEVRYIRLAEKAEFMTNGNAQPATKGDLDALKGDLNAFGERLETRIVGKLEKSLGNRIDSAVDTLARITKDGFDAVDKRFDGVDRRLDTLDRGQEDIHMRLTEVAYKIDVTDLTRRVDKIEHKVGISSV